MNILLVDDEQFQLETIRRGIRIHGHHVYMVTSGREALKVLEENPEDISLVITDYFMPDMNGIALTRSIRERYGDLPIILMTAYGDKSLVIEALRNRCDNYIDKPFKPSELVAQIDEIQLQREKRLRRGIKRKQPKRANTNPGELVWLEAKRTDRSGVESSETPELEAKAALEIDEKTQKIRRFVPLKRSQKHIAASDPTLADLTSNENTAYLTPPRAGTVLVPEEMEEAERLILEEESPLVRIGMGYTVPLVKMIFPLFIFLLVSLSCLYMLILPLIE